MRILQIHIGLNVLGGIEAFICYLINELVRDNDVTFCSIRKPQPDSFFYSRLDERVNKDYIKVGSEKFSFSLVWSIYKYLRDTSSDVIHIHGFFYYYAFAVLLLHKSKTFVYTFHSDAFKENSQWDKKILWFKKFCLLHNWIHAVTISPQSRDSFYKLYNVECELIENGIKSPLVDDYDNKIINYRMSKKTRVFMHPGRISVEKNQIVLCRVFERLISDGYDVVLLIAGTIQSEEVFNQLKLALSDRIIFLGERNDIPQLFYHSDGFCLPSIWEGLPITLLEALSVGCPPICSPVGGVVSVIKDGYNGFLSKSSDEEDYYISMKHFLNLSQEEIRRIKFNCIDSFKSYSIENTAKRYLSLYNEIKKAH